MTFLETYILNLQIDCLQIDFGTFGTLGTFGQLGPSGNWDLWAIRGSWIVLHQKDAQSENKIYGYLGNSQGD